MGYKHIFLLFLFLPPSPSFLIKTFERKLFGPGGTLYIHFPGVLFLLLEKLVHFGVNSHLNRAFSCCCCTPRYKALRYNKAIKQNTHKPKHNGTETISFLFNSTKLAPNLFFIYSISSFHFVGPHITHLRGSNLLESFASVNQQSLRDIGKSLGPSKSLWSPSVSSDVHRLLGSKFAYPDRHLLPNVLRMKGYRCPLHLNCSHEQKKKN